MKYNFVAVMKTEPDGRLAKRADFATKAEAEAHVDKFRDKYPDAFVAPIPPENEGDWKIDKSAKRISIEMRPPRPPEPEPEDLSGKIAALEARLTAMENRVR